MAKKEDTASQQQSVDIRYDLQSAYSFVESSRFTQAFSAFTVEEAHDQFIERVEGRSTPSRPNTLEKIDRVLSQVSASVAKIRSIPAESFRRPTQDDVNT